MKKTLTGWDSSTRLQPDDGLRVEQGFNLGLWNTEAQVGHEILPRVGLDHPGEDGDVLLALQPAPDNLHQLKRLKDACNEACKYVS